MSDDDLMAEWICTSLSSGRANTRVTTNDDGTVFAHHDGGDHDGESSATLGHRMTPGQAREIGLAYLTVAMRAEAGEGQ